MVESKNLDPKHKLFDMKSPILATRHVDPLYPQFKSVKEAKLQNNALKVEDHRINIMKESLELVGNKLSPANFEHVEYFKMKNAIGQIEVSNVYGCVIKTVGNCLVVVEND